MEACYGGTDVMERSCAVARGIDINKNARWDFYNVHILETPINASRCR
jgi:hypothetical protein